MITSFHENPCCATLLLLHSRPQHSPMLSDLLRAFQATQAIPRVSLFAISFVVVASAVADAVYCFYVLGAGEGGSKACLSRGVSQVFGLKDAGNGPIGNCFGDAGEQIKSLLPIKALRALVTIVVTTLYSSVIKW
eukprot:1576192-Rhodomonas_salina.2